MFKSHLSKTMKCAYYFFDIVLCNLGKLYIKCNVGERTQGCINAMKALISTELQFWTLLLSYNVAQTGPKFTAISLASVSPVLALPAYFVVFFFKI